MRFFPSLPDHFLRISSWRPGKLARDTLTMTSGSSLRTVAQTAVFIIVARILGVNGYGSFTAVLAIAGSLSYFVGLGSTSLLIRDVARDPKTFSTCWGGALVALAVSCPIMMIIYLTITWFIFSHSTLLPVILMIGMAELIFAPLANSAIDAYLGHERIGRASRLVLIPVITRLSAALLLMMMSTFLTSTEWLFTWSCLYAAASFAAAVYALLLINRDLNAPVFPSCKLLLSYIQEGLPFSFSNAALRINADIDKTMLARLSTIEVAGTYSAAYRVAAIASLPLTSLISVALPRFFRSARHGGSIQALSYARHILPIPLVYAIIASAILYFFADLLPLLLGKDYLMAVKTLRWLACLPIISFLRLIAQTSLLTSGFQTHCVIGLLGGAVINIMLNLWLIPSMGWQGAVIASYISEVSMTVTLYSMLWITR